MTKNFFTTATLLFVTIILCTAKISGQQTIRMYTGPLLSTSNEISRLNHNVIGTPYLNVNFLSATLGNSAEVVPMRYDAYLDKLEVLLEDKVYEVPKIKEFSLLKFKAIGATIIYLDGENGYFFRLIDGRNQLLKKEKIKLETVNASVEPNSTIREGYSKFERAEPTFFIKTDTGLIKITKKMDELINALPEDQQSKVKDFVKSEKIKLKQESDLIKLVTFLNK